MAHFAELGNTNLVLRVIVVDNSDCVDENGNESEQVGIAYCKSLFGEDTVWVQTSYNSNFRKNYAHIGGTYDQDNDAFIAEKPYPSWILDTDTFQWQSPIGPPPDEEDDPLGNAYRWDEENQQWVRV